MIVTVVPTVPDAGVKLVMVGAPITLNVEVLVAVPAGFTTLIVPVVAPEGTVVVMVVLFTTVKIAVVVLNLT